MHTSDMHISATTEKRRWGIYYSRNQVTFARVPLRKNSALEPTHSFHYRAPLYTTINATKALIYVVVFRNESGLLCWILSWTDPWILQGNSGKNFLIAAL